MTQGLTYDYAYDKELRDYLAPDDQRVQPHHPYWVGDFVVFLVRGETKRWHFRSPPGGGGGGSGIETPAHIFAKKFYKERMCFYATIEGQPILVRFSMCELEQRINERTPDVIATVTECWPPSFAPGSRFLIEIHAWNDIDRSARRRAALERIGLPCVEVHLTDEARRWKPGGSDRLARRRRFENYMRTLLSDPFHVEWIVPKFGVRVAASVDVLSLRLQA